ncbi:MAG: hypothetical protein OSB19_13745 [Opitutaceae bacterium]|nr:hypothetical protein [Opitutaceae bacterium]
MNTKLLALSIIGIATTTVTSMARPEGGRPGGKPAGDRPNPEDIVVEIVADYDLNTDNLINSEELAAAIEGLHEKRMEQMKAFAEKRGGNSDRERPERPRGRADRPEPSDIAAKLVADFDTDGDAALNTEELFGAVNAMKHQGPKNRRGPGPRGMRGHRGGPPPSDEGV